MEEDARRERPLSFLAGALWTLAAAIVAQLILSLVDGAHPGASNDLVSRTACQVLGQSVVVFVLLRLHEPDGSVRAMLGVKRPPLLALPFAALVGGGLAVPATLVNELVEKRFPVSQEETDLVEKIYAFDTPRQQAIVLVSMVLVTPIFDELFFRGALFTGLRKRARTDLVIFATAAYDALLGGNPRAAVSLLTLLVAIGWVRARTDSVWSSIVARVAFFAVAVGPEIVGAHAVPTTAVFVAAAAGAAAIGLLAIFALTRNRDAAAAR